MAGRAPFAGAVSIIVQIELPIPASWSAGKTADAINGDVHPTARPDLDNFLKAVLDAINGVVVADDAQVIEIAARKTYSVTPKTVLTIHPIPERAHTAALVPDFLFGGLNTEGK